MNKNFDDLARMIETEEKENKIMGAEGEVERGGADEGRGRMGSHIETISLARCEREMACNMCKFFVWRV